VRERDLFIEALQRETPGERVAFLDGACAGNDDLRGRIDRLLEEHQRQESFLLDSPSPGFAATMEQSVSEQPGAVIGIYKLLEQIGEGGFGVVFMAEQTQPVRRKVALKVLKPGMDTRQVVARFEAERQALALMDHPNIAHIHDGGETASRRPYFVMELVRGIPITDFCDQHHLNVRERLDLLINVCHAVQHAHQKGIIHRDLKPSNIMVTLHDSVAVVKVIDFGIAKVTGQQLTEKTLFTNFAQLIGTPMYMSPEQAHMSGLDIDTRTDIYSLGVLLYELLTGTTPFDRERLRTAPYDEIRRIIREEEPPKPSTRMSTLGAAASTTSANRQSDPVRLRQILRGDLDWIVMKCLEKDRNRRYETASGLSRDIQRYLRDAPVVACPPTPSYRLRKFARRNKVVLAVGALISAAIVLTIVGATGYSLALHQAQVADRLREAQARTAKALEVANTEREEATRLKAEADAYRLQAQRVSATLAMERGLFLCERGDAATGLLWLGHSLELAPPIDLALHREIRSNLANWQHAIHPLRAALHHGLPVEMVAFSPSGQTVLTASHDKTAQLWDRSTGRRLATLQHHDKVYAGVFSADGRLIATGSQDGTARLWNATTGEPLSINPMRHRDYVGSLAFSGDCRRLVTGSWDHTAQVWDVLDGKPIGPRLQHADMVHCVAVSPNDRVVATASRDHTVQLWDASTGEPLMPPFKHDDAVTRVAFSPNGEILATGGLDGTRLWHLATRNSIAEVLGVGKISALVFSRDGQSLLMGCGTGTAQILDIATGNQRGTNLAHQTGICAAVFSPDDKWVLTGTDDGLARLWDSVAGSSVGMPLRHQDRVSSVAFSLDGKAMLTGTYEGTAWLRDVGTGDPGSVLLRHGKGVTRAAFSRDGKMVLSGCGDGSAWLWDAATGKLLRPIGPHSKHMLAVTFSPDGSFLATSSGDFTAQLWETSTGKHRATMEHADRVASVAVSPDGRIIATAAYDRTARLWNAVTGQQLLVFEHEAEVNVVVFSPDCQFLLTGSEDATARLWNLPRGDLIGSPLKHRSGVNSVAFSPDAKRVATGSDDHTAVIWDVDTRQQITLGHQSGVSAVAFSSDGRIVVTASSDWTAQLWDSTTGKRLCGALEHQGAVLAAAFSPDGRSLVTASTDGTARLWDTATGKSLSGALRHDGPVVAAVFSPDGRTILTASSDKTARLWRPLAPLQGDADQIVLSIQVQTGLELDSDGVVHVLDSSTWHERKRRLDDLAAKLQ
jgi:WD40 repeat protein/serine/threonine protein kinase